MSELSKTARASMGKAVKEKYVETTEEAIRQIRLNIDAGLYVGDNVRVGKLLLAYDVLQKQYTESISSQPLIVPAEPTVVMAEFDNREEPGA